MGPRAHLVRGRTAPCESGADGTRREDLFIQIAAMSDLPGPDIMRRSSATGMQEKIPPVKKRPATVHVHLFAIVHKRGSRYLMKE